MESMKMVAPKSSPAVAGVPEKAHLKAERVQLSRAARLKAERVQEALKRLPGWELDAGGREIVRTRRFKDPVGARAFVGLVCRLSSGQRQPVEIRLAREQVVVTLKGHPVRGCAGGLGSPVFKLAEMIG